MSILNKGIIFMKLNAKTRLLFIEAFFYLGWARILLQLPFSKVAPSLGTHMQETPYYTHVPSKKNLLKDVSNSIYAMSNYTLWDSKCFVKAIAGAKMLERRGIESTLYLGTSRDEKGKMIAHAWLRSGSFYITGTERMGQFTVVGKFAKTISGQH